MRRGSVLVCSLAAMLMAAPVLAQSPPETPAETTAAPAAPTLAMRAASRIADVGGRSAHADDVAALRQYYAANPDKPLWIEAGAMSARARAVMSEIAQAEDWGLVASAFPLPSEAADPADAEAQLSLAALKYARHARGGRLDPTQLTEAIDRQNTVIVPSKVLADLAASSTPDAYLRKLHPQHPQFERLRKLYVDLRSGKIQPEQPAAPAPVAQTEEPPRKGKKRKKKVIAAAPKLPPPLTAERVLFNMEQWRWMPEDLGRLHVRVNIPEFEFKVVKDAKPIHSERVIVGAIDTQTPIFSKDMETVVFQPGWGVPPSIKVKQLLPGLLAGRDPVSARGYTMSYRGRQVSAGSIDWRSVDIRKVSIVQPPGPSNALGMVKFLFPNKHDVYMHDTPTKALFNSETRAYSHGCVRVRNPMRFAEIIFAETAEWAPTRVASLARGKPDNQVKVPGPIAVHITYFTVVVDDDGKVHTYRDLYGHEARVQGGLEGRIAQVAKKPSDLNAVRSSLVNRAGARRVASSYEDDRLRARQQQQRQRQSSNSGGGFLWW